MDFLDEDAFTKQFQQRLAETRGQMKLTAGQIAHSLRIKEDAYKKYEKRAGSKFPLYLLPRLIYVTGRPPSYWFGQPTGGTPQIRIVKKA